MTERPGWAARIGALLFSGVFMLAFGGVGVFFGLLPLVDTIHQAWLVRTWTPVSAQVLDVALLDSRSSKGGITYQVRARYAYRLDGRDHESTRIGLDRQPSYDNIGDWHRRWHAVLSDARSREQPVGAWANPRQPGEAVLERRVRWGLMLFHVPFALVFTAVGLGAAIVFMRALLGVPTAPPRRLSSAPAPSRAAPPSPSLDKLRGSGNWNEVPVPARPARQALPALPPGVRGSLLQAPHALHFVRLWPPALALMLGLTWVLWVLAQVSDAPASLVSPLPMAVFGTAWAALTVHLATLRWVWRVESGALVLERGSWLRSKRQRLGRQDLRQLSHLLVYSSRTGNGPLVEHRRLLARLPHGAKLALTPALAGDDAAAVTAWHLEQALADAGSAPAGG